MTSDLTLPRAFIERRLHSLTGLFLVLYLVEHLLVNSQAALFFGDDGNGFVRAVNSIHNLPYLPIIEMILLGIPILLHGWWGVQYLKTGEPNSYDNTGIKPYLPEYPRNRAYTWQRITSWILLFGILAHVIHMRFIEYPIAVKVGTINSYIVRLNHDSGLETLAARLGFEIYNVPSILSKKHEILNAPKNVKDPPEVVLQRYQQERKWIDTIEKIPLKPGQVIAVSNSFGLAELLMVRETFKMPLMIALYTILVLAACFHAFNGLWTFMISWGITLTQASQTIMLRIAQGLMVLVAFMGLATIWGTYWINLKQ